MYQTIGALVKVLAGIVAEAELFVYVFIVIGTLV
jgi:hypothetical protein